MLVCGDMGLLEVDKQNMEYGLDGLDRALKALEDFVQCPHRHTSRWEI
jgi:hypothetical protein